MAAMISEQGVGRAPIRTAKQTMMRQPSGCADFFKILGKLDCLAAAPLL
jgi:hypothetical protein